MFAYHRLSIGALALAVATPALAQPVTQAGNSGAHQPGPFASLSPQGREILRAARQATRDDGTRQQIDAARAQILTLLDADTLDVGALSRAMLTERNLAAGGQARRQAAMLSAYQKFSTADRHAFVAATRAVQARIGAERAQHHGWGGPA